MANKYVDCDKCGGSKRLVQIDRVDLDDKGRITKYYINPEPAYCTECDMNGKKKIHLPKRKK